MSDTPLYRLKNLNNDNVISVCKEQFTIGRAASESRRHSVSGPGR